MFEELIRNKVRFDLNGSINAEDVYDIKKEILADYEAKLQERIEKRGKRNRFAKKSTSDSLDELRLKFVTHVIDLKIAEEEESASAAVKKVEREKLLAEKAKRSEAKIGTISDEELDKKLAELS